MTGLHRVFDAAYPPAEAPPGCDSVLGYIGGQRATNIWTLEEWERFGRLAQFPAYVPDFTAEDPHQAADRACRAMMQLGWAPGQPNLRAVVCDLETLVQRSWYSLFAAAVAGQGFTAVAYGSLSTVLENAASDVWAAAWDGSAVLLPGQTVHAHQYQAGVSFGGTQVDYSVADDWLFARGGQGPRHT